MLRRDQRPHVRRFIQRRSHLPTLRLVLQSIDNPAKIARSTYTRSAQRQTCPVFRNTASLNPSTVRSKSQSANTTAAFFPPSSKEIGFTDAATVFIMAAPVADSPVNVTAATPGCFVKNSPAEPGPKPCTTL